MREKAYRWDADDYAGHSQAQFTWAQELIAKLDLAPDETILDLGCGDGKASALIAASVPIGSVLGVDNSRAMINLAREQFPSSAYPNLIFQVTDAVRLPFDRRFDAVFSNAALHWVQDHLSVLRGVKRALKRPGGFLPTSRSYSSPMWWKIMSTIILLTKGTIFMSRWCALRSRPPIPELFAPHICGPCLIACASVGWLTMQNPLPTIYRKVHDWHHLKRSLSPRS